MTLSTYIILQRRIDDAIKTGDPSAIFSAATALNGYLIAELDRAEGDRTMLMDMIRELRARIEHLENQA